MVCCTKPKSPNLPILGANWFGYFPTTKGFFNAGNDGQCMQKVIEREIACELHLVLVDDLRDDEECHPFDQMRFSKKDLLMVMLLSMTLTPLSTCPTKEIN